MRSGAEPREQGFSLVEVLCALAIAAAAIAVLLGGVSQSLRAGRSLDDRLGARLLLSSILDDELSAPATAPALREGLSGPYRWRLEIVPAGLPGGTGPLPAGIRLYRLLGSVAWGEGGRLEGQVLKLAR